MQWKLRGDIYLKTAKTRRPKKQKGHLNSQANGK